MQQTRVKLANGIELDAVDTGLPSPDAETLIFLHGFPESHRTWRHQIAHLRGRYRCIAPDQRGYRGSSKPQDVDSYTPDKLIGDIFLLADALGVGDFTIVGHDWGGAMAWGVAIGGQKLADGRGRVTRAVVANAPHPAVFQRLLYTHPGQRESSQYIRGFRDPANDKMLREDGLTALLLREVKWDRPGAMESEERAALLQDWQDREASVGMINWYRATPLKVPPMDAPFEVPSDFVPPALPKLSIPTLIVWGMDDLALPPENLDGLDELIDDLTLVKVPDCGHFVPWEAPEQVNAALDEFLGRSS